MHQGRAAHAPTGGDSSPAVPQPSPRPHHANNRALEKQLAGADEASLDALLPPKAGDLEQSKLGAPARGVIYSLDGVPVLFDLSGKGDLYVPTAMALWAAPGLLSRIPLKHPAVSQFIVGAAHGRHGHGADVMLPGVDTEALPPFGKGALVAVVVPGNPAPIAVGLATLSAEDACTAGRGAGKGKLVEVLQAYGDYLYAQAAGKPVPNEGFLEMAVAPLPGAWEGGDDKEGEALAAAAAAAGGAEPGADGEGSGGGGPAPPAEEASSSNPQSSGGADVDMDALLESALLQALHKSVKVGDLPLAGSILW
jgi:translation initiation factor 2D